MARRSYLPAVVAIALLVSACGSSGPELTGFGATLATWNAAHHEDRDDAGLRAYGPSVATPQGPMPQFVEVMPVDGRVTQYVEVLRIGTSLADAKEAVLLNLPSTIRTVSFIVTASCAFWNLTSPDLKTATGSPSVMVEMAHDDSLGTSWQPGGVNTLTFNTGRARSSNTC